MPVLALRRLATPLGLAFLVVSVPLLARFVDGAQLAATAREAVAAPVAVAGALSLYGLAFAVRARLWTRVLPSLSFGHALAAIHVSLLGNHVLPLRLGEALRVSSAVRRARIPLREAIASTVFLRAADTLAVAGLAAALSPAFAARLVGAWGLALLAAAIALWGAGIVWLRRLARARRLEIRVPLALVTGGAVAAWLLESAVLWQAAQFAGIELGVLDAVLVTSVTIAAQVVAVTPGGIGTYEATATGALVALGADPGAALAAAVTAHALKSAYSLAGGAIALVRPAPGLLGRMRLRRRPERAPAPSPPDGAPVVLFLPAHDECDAVAGVVRRVPDVVLGRPVVCLVVDDGSTDGTAAAAAAAGAVIVRHEERRGLGAAVRTGLEQAVASSPAAVVFCDADGEYAPEELERLVAPVLAGEADYVVGSRFAGHTRRMRPHRVLGNLLLTRLLRLVARAPIGDGQSGFRALSPRAAAAAEVIHDFNYAQVLTLDLLGKGYRYAEVPISYRFRTTGRSFVRLGPYLRRVVPAVYRELNA
jgi:uncharacterized membrane protein YbhN (UPF0104 family)